MRSRSDMEQEGQGELAGPIAAAVAKDIEALLSLLPDVDRVSYRSLQEQFRIVTTRYAPRYTGTTQFLQHVHAVYGFVMRGDGLEATRALVCGIFFGKTVWLVHTVRLGFLLSRTKSAINFAYQRLGMVALRSGCDVKGVVMRLVPGVCERLTAAHNWAVRRVCSVEPFNRFHFEGQLSPEVEAEFEVGVPSAQSKPATGESASAPAPAAFYDMKQLLNRPAGFTESVIWV